MSSFTVEIALPRFFHHFPSHASQHRELEEMAEVKKQQDDRPLKFTLTHYRKEGITHDAFMKWLVEVHLPKAFPVLKKHGVTGYALVSRQIIIE